MLLRNESINDLGIVDFIKRTIADFNYINYFKALCWTYVKASLEYAYQIWSPYYTFHFDNLKRKCLKLIAYKLRILLKLNFYLK